MAVKGTRSTAPGTWTKGLVFWKQLVPQPRLKLYRVKAREQVVGFDPER